MKRASILALTVCGVMLPVASASDNDSRTMRGWFVDEACTRGRVAQGKIEPDNPECAKRCVKEGSALMFMSETDKALFAVKDPTAQEANIGFYVEVVGNTREKALTVSSVKKLAELKDMCQRPKLKNK
jgi:hypothetical protein